MSQLHDWALRWAIPYDALKELSATLGAVIVEPSPMSGKSEAAVQAAKRLQASNRGGRLWRNNLGAYLDEHGNFIRYGLCNDTPALNKVMKSSDLIGVYPLRITQEHVGSIVGQFWAVECKAGNWTHVSDDREEAQLAFGRLVVALGGRFEFENGANRG